MELLGQIFQEEEKAADELLLESGASRGAGNTLDPEYVLDSDINTWYHNLSDGK